MKLDNLGKKKILIIAGLIIVFIIGLLLLIFNNSNKENINHYEGFTGGDYTPAGFIAVDGKKGWNQPVKFINKQFTLGQFLTTKIEADTVNYVKSDMTNYISSDQWPKSGIILEIDNIVIEESGYSINHIDFDINVRSADYKYKARVKFDKNIAQEVMVKRI